MYEKPIRSYTKTSHALSAMSRFPLQGAAQLSNASFSRSLMFRASGAVVLHYVPDGALQINVLTKAYSVCWRTNVTEAYFERLDRYIVH